MIFKGGLEINCYSQGTLGTVTTFLFHLFQVKIMTSWTHSPGLDVGMDIQCAGTDGGLMLTC